MNITFNKIYNLLNRGRGLDMWLDKYGSPKYNKLTDDNYDNYNNEPLNIQNTKETSNYNIKFCKPVDIQRKDILIFKNNILEHDNLIACFDFLIPSTMPLKYQHLIEQSKSIHNNKKFIFGIESDNTPYRKLIARQQGQFNSIIASKSNNLIDTSGIVFIYNCEDGIKMEWLEFDNNLKRDIENSIMFLEKLNSGDAKYWDIEQNPPYLFLRPNMKGFYPLHWEEAYMSIAKQQGELTLVPGISAKRRQKTWDNGIYSTNDPNFNMRNINGLPVRNAKILQRCGDIKTFGFFDEKGKQTFKNEMEKLLMKRIICVDCEYISGIKNSAYSIVISENNLINHFNNLFEFNKQISNNNVNFIHWSGDDRNQLNLPKSQTIDLHLFTKKHGILIPYITSFKLKEIAKQMHILGETSVQYNIGENGQNAHLLSGENLLEYNKKDTQCLYDIWCVYVKLYNKLTKN